MGKLTSEQRGEVRQRGNQIVNSVQIKELHEVIEFLAEEIFSDSLDHYYVIIDRLDESWVDGRRKSEVDRPD
jgi:cell division ATPase FtsA